MEVGLSLSFAWPKYWQESSVPLSFPWVREDLGDNHDCNLFEAELGKCLHNYQRRRFEVTDGEEY
jgi:hypothetical protein